MLSVNYRGSTGFGKAFVNAANLEWGGKMHDDLIDAVDWAIAQKIALADKVAIYGASYGGYAALVGATFTPEKFACAIDVFGISKSADLPGHDPGLLEVLANPESTDGRLHHRSRPQARKRSPLNRVETSCARFGAQGANDVQVKPSESDQIVGPYRHATSR